MALFVTVLKLILLIQLSGVISEDIERLSDASISKAIHENVTMVWNVKGITTTVGSPLNIFISKGEFNVSGVNMVLQFTVYISNSLPIAAVGDISAYKKLASRSTAIYTYTGKSSAGQETARVSFTINNLTLDDEGSYILTARDTSLGTNLSVNFGPEKCGSGLKTKYTVNPEDQLMIVSGFCGKPQPNVTCSLNGRPVNNVVINEVSPYNYTYTFIIPKLKPCDRKEMSYTVAGYGKAYKESTTVIVVSNISRFTKNIVFVRDCDKCSTVSWRKEDAGKCDVRYQLQFFNGTNAITASVMLMENSYSNCSVQAQSVKVTTYESKQLLANRTDYAQLDYTPCTATTTTTTTSEELNEKEEKTDAETVIEIIFGAVVAMIIFIVMWLMFIIKCGRTRINLEMMIRESNPERNIQFQDDFAEENNTVRPPSDCMELQAVRNDTTHQGLTSIQAEANSTPEFCEWEEYHNDKFKLCQS